MPGQTPRQEIKQAQARLKSMTQAVADAREGARNALAHAKEARRAGRPKPNLERAVKAAVALRHAKERHLEKTAPLVRKTIALHQAVLRQGRVRAPTKRTTRRGSPGRRRRSSSSKRRRSSSSKRRRSSSARRRRSSSPSSSLRRAAGRVHQLGAQTNQILEAMGQAALTPPPALQPRSARETVAGDAGQARAEANLAAAMAAAGASGSKSPRALHEAYERKRLGGRSPRQW